jgi:DNA-directed RNA polymerase beta' subunit
LETRTLHRRENPINLSQELNAEIILAIFKRILEDDALVMGFSPKWCMPSWLIITVLPVVPPSVRPSVRQYNSQRSEDDLTNKYYEIIKNCQKLRDKLSKNVNGGLSALYLTFVVYALSPF